MYNDIKIWIITRVGESVGLGVFGPRSDGDQIGTVGLLDSLCLPVDKLQNAIFKKKILKLTWRALEKGLIYFCIGT